MGALLVGALGLSPAYAALPAGTVILASGKSAYSDYWTAHGATGAGLDVVGYFR